MKYKNYKSAIHNFTDSFMSIDYMKSGKLALNVLIDLYNLQIESKATFDFINKTIVPVEANSKSSQELLKDYMNWLPDHFSKHKCDLSKLEKLEITIWSDFNKATIPQGRSNQKEFSVHALTKRKAADKDEEIIEITQCEILKFTFLKTRLPEL